MKTVIEMAREAGAIHIHKRPKEFAVVGNKAIERFAELVRAEEREACAKVCDVTVLGDEYLTAFINAHADAIRARGEASIRSNNDH